MASNAWSSCIIFPVCLFSLDWKGNWAIELSLGVGGIIGFTIGPLLRHTRKKKRKLVPLFSSFLINYLCRLFAQMFSFVFWVWRLFSRCIKSCCALLGLWGSHLYRLLSSVLYSPLSFRKTTTNMLVLCLWCLISFQCCSFNYDPYCAFGRVWWRTIEIHFCPLIPYFALFPALF